MQAYQEDPTATLFSRAKAGDQGAWRVLFEECYPKVRRVISRKLNQPMRSLYDSTDIASDVWTSLVAKFDRFEFDSIDAFEAFLMKAAQDRLTDAYRKSTSIRRDYRRTTRLNATTADGTELGGVVPSSDPTPSQVASAKDTYEAARSQLDETGRNVLDLAFARFTKREIADGLGLNLRTVQRLIKNIGDSGFLGGKH